jgi:hypothetical protein
MNLLALLTLPCGTSRPQPALDWIQANEAQAEYRYRKLIPTSLPSNGSTPNSTPAQRTEGFSRIDPVQAGVLFTNIVTESHIARNHNFMNGSGVAAGDFDGDGWCDLYFCSIGAPNVLYRNLGGWRFEEAAGSEAVKMQGFASTGAVFADVDGDGDLDLVASAYGAGYVAWYENADGMGTMWTAHTIDDAVEAARAVDAADMDGDGDIDVVGAAFAADEILWWENVDGAGTSWSEHPIKSDFNGPSSVQATDMDGDGDLDVLATATFGTMWPGGRI